MVRNLGSRGRVCTRFGTETLRGLVGGGVSRWMERKRGEKRAGPL